MNKKINIVKNLKREFNLDLNSSKGIIDEDKRLVELKFSSEEPYLRGFGYEIIDHKNMKMDRLNNGATFLFNHDWDMPIGKVEKSWVEGNNGYALIRFSKSKRAKDFWQDVKDGILTKISFGYEILKLTENGMKDNIPMFKASTIPYEISLVTVPADDTVGISRSKKKETEEEEVEVEVESEEEVAEEVEEEVNEEKSDELIENKLEGETIVVEEETDEEVKEAEVEEEDDEEVEENEEDKVKSFDNCNKNIENNINILNIKGKNMTDRNQEIKEILSLGTKMNEVDLAQEFVLGEKSLNEFKDALIAKRNTQPTENNKVNTVKDNKEFSLTKALRNAVSNTKSGFEYEVSKRLSEENGKSLKDHSFYIPLTRDYEIGAATGPAGDATGGILVENKLTSFIDALYNNLAVSKAGAVMLPGLKGDIDIPRFTNSVAPVYASELTALTAQNGTFDRVPLRRRVLAATAIVSRDLIHQSNLVVEPIITNAIVKKIAEKMDSDILQGTGLLGAPTGITGVVGVNSVSVAGNMTFAKLVEFESKILEDNALVGGSLKYVTHPSVAGSMKTIAKSGTNNGFLLEGNIANGYELIKTAGLTPNVANHKMICGDWSQCFVGLWDGLEVVVDPYTLSTSGGIRITVYFSYDFALAHPESFAVATDITVA